MRKYVFVAQKCSFSILVYIRGHTRAIIDAIVINVGLEGVRLID